MELDLVWSAVDQHFVLSNDLSRSFVAIVHNIVDVRSPEVEGIGPGGHSGEGHNHNEWTVLSSVMSQPVHEGDSLNGLAQSHLVGEDDIVAFAPVVA